MYIYNKKRDVICNVVRADSPTAYDEVMKAIRTKSATGLKGYFSAVLQSQDELVVKVSEVLAEQPW